jgi:hypothetical protein
LGENFEKKKKEMTEEINLEYLRKENLVENIQVRD